MIAALFGIIQKLRSQIDWVVIALMFIISLVLLVWGKRRHPQANARPLPKTPSVGAPATINESSGSLGVAPRPLITYDGAGVMVEGRWAELLNIYNDGPITAKGISFGDLTWVERRTFTICRAIPEVPTKNHGTAYLAFNAENGQRLNDFLHQRPDLKPTVTVSFQDPNGNQFFCDYELKPEIDGRVTWNPGPVRLRSLE